MTEIRTIKIEELGKSHAVFFTREFSEDWGYMGMRDYSTYEPTDKYGVEVVPYDICGRAHNCDAGYAKYSFRAEGFDKDMANKIWWNIKNGISYMALRDALNAEGFITAEA